MDHGICPHDEAHFMPTVVEGVWERVCECCGLRAYGVSLAEAKRVFGQEAERVLVEGLMRKREAGLDLAAHEEAAIAYSPYGTAARCRTMGFFLG
jgi:hypothetical protein